MSHRLVVEMTSRPDRGAGTILPHPPMPSTHLSLHYHIVFSTKDRAPLITTEWRDRLHAFLGGTIKTLDGIPQAIGGVADHVHLLIGLPATHCLADLMRDLKAVSSRWVHETLGQHSFAWQEGYGAFTVGASQREAVCDYIRRQKEHHQSRTFQEEYLALLSRGGVKYDERYLW
jgi:REP element-mobilizing transposase RayT